MQALLEPLFKSGHAVDIALVCIGLEFAFLLWRGPESEKLKTLITLILALGPGVCLMLALRCALTQANLIWVAFWLTLSLPLHIGDLLRRKP